jgi:hypothetical protein
MALKTREQRSQLTISTSSLKCITIGELELAHIFRVCREQLVSFDFHLGIGQARPSSTSTSAERKKEKSKESQKRVGEHCHRHINTSPRCDSRRGDASGSCPHHRPEFHRHHAGHSTACALGVFVRKVCAVCQNKTSLRFAVGESGCPTDRSTDRKGWTKEGRHPSKW